MPPPIIPASASANRGAPARATETAPARGLGNPLAPSPVAPAPLRRQEKPEPAVAGSKAEPLPPAAPTVSAAPPASGAFGQPRPPPKTPPPAPPSDETQKPADPRPQADKTNLAFGGKPAPKADDPFADLDSLEAEMARLLGREKSD